jgi:NitT/TauT family transport system substrate-binding protein
LKKLISTAILAVILAPWLVSCGGGTTANVRSSPPPTATRAASTPTPTVQAQTSEPQQRTLVVLGMGYIPDVQFAPLYVALEKGYFAEEGLNIEFKYGMEDDLLKLVGTDKLQFVIGSGDQVILARSQGLPAVYVMAWYRRFPVSVVALREKGIKQPQALEGKKVGIPCLCGASYVAWQALVYAADLDEEKVDLQVIGFNQAAAVAQEQVDAAVVYTVNTPVRLRLEGREVDVIHVSDYIDLISNGIITNERTIAEHPALVEGLVRATLKGLQDTLDNPEEAFELCLRQVPEAGGENEAVNKAILEASIELWQGENLGRSDPEVWQTSQRFMYQVGLIETESEVDKLFTNQFVP